jgi:secondary thiamine-phosphate synthase enzyme
MPVKTSSISLDTRGNTEVVDLTQQVAGIIRQAGLANGIVTVFCPSSTSGLTTLEYEPGCVKDLRQLFEELIPSNRDWAHNVTWDDGSGTVVPNGHSHLRAALLGASLTVPFEHGRLALGTWQQIVYVDFDVRSRHRELVVQVMGE